MKTTATAAAAIALFITIFFFPFSHTSAQQSPSKSSIYSTSVDPLGYRDIIKALLRLLSAGSSTEQSPTPTPKSSPGQPSSPPPTTISQKQTDNSPIVDWARRISAALERGTWNYFNKQLTTISNGNYAAYKRSGDSIYNLYWCTDIIIDAYNLAGHSGLGTGQESVFYMRRFFAANTNYRYLDFRSTDSAIRKNSLANVRVGDVIIMQSAFDQHVTDRSDKDGQHAAIVNTISFDSNRCNGYMDTLEANWSKKTARYNIDNCNIVYSAFPVVAFAGK